MPTKHHPSWTVTQEKKQRNISIEVLETDKLPGHNTHNELNLKGIYLKLKKKSRLMKNKKTQQSCTVLQYNYLFKRYV